MGIYIDILAQGPLLEALRVICLKIMHQDAKCTMAPRDASDPQDMQTAEPAQNKSIYAYR